MYGHFANNKLDSISRQIVTSGPRKDLCTDDGATGRAAHGWRRRGVFIDQGCSGRRFSDRELGVVLRILVHGRRAHQRDLPCRCHDLRIRISMTQQCRVAQAREVAVAAFWNVCILFFVWRRTVCDGWEDVSSLPPASSNERTLYKHYVHMTWDMLAHELNIFQLKFPLVVSFYCTFYSGVVVTGPRPSN